ncbi:uncharacterized protein LOC127861282 isoform X2 [Dreissena polymorpha]|uniref:uncharacterized protein LOC127861282 isoform X2 n=1 Tax=Dreissena polymorpha TaxID=45954 RepID=UPI0022652AD6|nr:uncharacterized protein LOC127861282 isoform X2 [Dreissena polymorpha]
MTAVSVAMEKKNPGVSESKTETRGSASWSKKCTCIIVVLVAIISIAIGALMAILIANKFFLNCTPPHDGAVVDELVVRRGALTLIMVRGQGLMIIDHEQRLKVLSFDHIKDACYVSKIDQDDNDLNTTVQVSDPSTTVMYVAGNQSFEPEILLGFLQGVCKTAYWMHVDLKGEGSLTARAKRSCGNSCIMVCTSPGQCSRQCVKNPCPRTGPLWV